MQPAFSSERKDRRHHRVVELLRTEIFHILQREVKDPRLKRLTITEIDLKPDLRSAKIYVTLLPEVENSQIHEPSEKEREELVQGLTSASHFIYEQLKRRLFMKVTPSIRFEYDSRLSELSKVWGLTTPQPTGGEG